jgi:chromosome segregation ATPase
MAASDGGNADRALSIDWLFAQLPGQDTGYRTPMPLPGAGASVVAAPLTEPSGSAPASAMAWTQPPPALEDPADLETAYEWLRSEKQRLEEYTRSQFATIQQQHQALLNKHFHSEQSLALRCQELNREMKFLAGQAETLQRRARELAEREAALSAQMERLAHAQEELLTLEQTSQNIRQDTETQRSLLEQLRAQTAELQVSDLASRHEFDNFEVALKERQRAWEEKQAEISARQAEMEERYAALEKAEEAAKRRLAELDELEERMQQEIHEHEQQLAQERRDMEIMRAKLRGQVRAHLPLSSLTRSNSVRIRSDS